MPREVFDLTIKGAEGARKFFDSVAAGTSKLTQQVTALARGGSLSSRLVGSDAEIKAKTKSVQRLTASAGAGVSALAARYEKLSAFIELGTKRQTELVRLAQTTSDPKLLNQYIQKAEDLSDRLEQAREQMAQTQSLMKGRAPSRFGGLDASMGMGAGYAVQGGLSAGSQALRFLSGGGYDETPNLLGKLAESLDKLGEAAGIYQQFNQTFRELAPFAKTIGKPLRGIVGAFGGIVKFAGPVLSSVGTLVTSLPVLGGALSAVGGAVSTVAAGVMAALGPVGLLIGAVGAAAGAFALAARDTQNVVKQMENFLESERTLREFQLDAATSARNMTLEQVNEQKEDIEARRRVLHDGLQRLRDEQKRLNEEYAALGSSIAPSKRSELGDAGQKLQQDIDEVVKELAALDTQMQLTDSYLTPLVAEQERLNKQLEAQQRATENLAEAHEAYIDTAASIVDTLEEAERRRADFEEQVAYDRARELRERARADEKALQEHQKALLQIEEDNRNRIEEIRAELAKSIADAVKQLEKEELEAREQLAKSLAETETELNQQLIEAEQAYADESYAAFETHQKQILDLEDDYAKRRKQRLDELNAALLDAELANDALAFIQAEEAAARDLKQMEDEHKEGLVEAEQQYAEERAQRAEEHQKNLEDMRSQAAERRAELLAQYEEERAERLEAHQENLAQMRLQAEEQLAQQREEHKKALETERAAFAERQAQEAEERAWQDMLREEDLQRQREQMQKETEAQLAEINDRSRRIVEVIRNEGRVSISEVEQRERAMRAAQIQSYQWAMGELNRIKMSTTMQPQIQQGLSQFGQSNLFTSIRNTTQSIGGMLGGMLGASATRPVMSSIGGAVNQLMSRLGGRPLGAAKGALIEKPTLLIAGEGERPELVLPFDKSRGIPDDVLGTLVAGLNRFNSAAMATGGTTYQFTMTGDIHVGDGVSRDEVARQFQLMGQTIVRALAGARGGTT